MVLQLRTLRIASEARTFGVVSSSALLLHTTKNKTAASDDTVVIDVIDSKIRFPSFVNSTHNFYVWNHEQNTTSRRTTRSYSIAPRSCIPDETRGRLDIEKLGR